MPTFVADFNGQVIATSDQTVSVEGNRYFPRDSVAAGVLTATRSKSLCMWKGVASYYSLEVAGVEARNVAWSYRHPSPLARRIKNQVAFDGSVQVFERS